MRLGGVKRGYEENNDPAFECGARIYFLGACDIYVFMPSQN